MAIVLCIYRLMTKCKMKFAVEVGPKKRMLDAGGQICY